MERRSNRAIPRAEKKLEIIGPYIMEKVSISSIQLNNVPRSTEKEPISVVTKELVVWRS